MLARRGDSYDDLDGGNGNDFLNGEDGGDYLWGGDGNDTLNGGDGDDVLDDYSGDNVLNAGDGNDSVYVEGGNNVINAGAGDDYVSTGGGVNEVTLGEGADILSIGSNYVYYAEDAAEAGDGESGGSLAVDDDYVIVTDFSPPEDTFEIFDAAYDELTFEQDGSNTNILNDGDLLAVVQGVNPSDLSEDNVISYDSYWPVCGTGDALTCYIACGVMEDTADAVIEADDLGYGLGSGSEEISFGDMAVEPMIADMIDIEPASFM